MQTIYMKQGGMPGATFLNHFEEGVPKGIPFRGERQVLSQVGHQPPQEMSFLVFGFIFASFSRASSLWMVLDVF